MSGANNTEFRTDIGFRRDTHLFSPGFARHELNTVSAGQQPDQDQRLKCPLEGSKEGTAMFRRVLITLLTAAFCLSPTTSFARSHKAPVSTGALQLFSTESAAQAHCPSDTVVWLNTNSGIYHEKGMRWYGRTKSGAYVCKKEADAAGDRDTRNGQ